MKKYSNFSAAQREDLLYLLRHKYEGNIDYLSGIWGISELEALREAAQKEDIEVTVPDIDELKADAYRQLKGAIVRTADPQKLANTLKILEDMKDRGEGRDMEERSKGISESIASLAQDAPPPGLEDISLEPVVAEHVKKPRRRKRVVRPSGEVNGLDENSDTP